MRSLIAHGFAASILAAGPPQAGARAPDGAIAAIPAIQKWFTSGGVTAYSLGFTTCNLGDDELAWAIVSNQHPVFAQNIYRLKDGRFEQLGLSWLMHGFCALQSNVCGTCIPAGGGGCPPALGTGCSSPDSASAAGQQFNLGPRSQVNASTGFFPANWNLGLPTIGSSLDRRLQVHVSDLDPALNVGAAYFAEAIIVQPEDALAVNNHNNASHRAVLVGTLAMGGYNLLLTGAIDAEQPALTAWQDADPGVAIAAVDVPADGANLDGRFLVAHRAAENRDGTWHYEYAIFNLSSLRGARSFSVPVPAGVAITNIDFHDVDYHSGDGVNNITTDGTDWSAGSTEGSDSQLVWNTQGFDENPNANALRWGTLYNFRFDADQPPTEVKAALGLFKPGSPEGMSVLVVGPAGPVVCAADLNADDQIDGADLGDLLLQWGDCPINCFTLTCTADLNDDCVVDGGDLGDLLLAWGECE